MKILTDALLKADKVSRQDLLDRERELGPLRETRKIQKEQSLFLITNFNPEFNGLKEIVTENWILLKRSSTTKILVEMRIIFGHRRPKNLKDMLVRDKVNQTPKM